MPVRSKKNEHGMTLVELLAAITILSIILVGIMSVFPQMTNFNMQTEEKLDTMYLARVELAALKENKLEALYERDPSPDAGTEHGILIFSYEKDGYQYEVDYHEEPDLYDEYEDAIQLNKIHIKVHHNGEEISESFGYLKNAETS